MNTLKDEMTLKLPAMACQLYDAMCQLPRQTILIVDETVFCFTTPITTLAHKIGKTNATTLKFVRILEEHGLLKRETPKRFGPSTYYVANRLNYFPRMDKK